MTRLRSGSSALIRDLNRTAVLALIGQHAPIARVEIARRLALSPATVTVLTRDLVRDGLVREVDQAPSSGGRPPLLLGLVPQAAQAIGAKVAEDRLTAVRVDFEGTPLEYAERPFEAAAPDAADRLGLLLEDLVARWRDAGPRVLGVGLGVPGVVDTPSGGRVESPVLGWRDLPLGARLESQLGIPVLVDNDVNTLAVAERLYGRGRNVDHFATVTIGRGVGLGIVIGGELYRGARGGAGEFGHVRVMEDGPRCHCGKRGCLEAVASDDALVRDARAAKIIAPTDDIDALRALADDRNEVALELYAKAGRVLGHAIAGLANVLSPGLVIVSGEGTQAWEHLQTAFRTALAEDLFEPLRGLPIEVDPWDDAKWARGAAALVLRATFAAPLYERQPDDAVRARLVEPLAEELA